MSLPIATKLRLKPLLAELVAMPTVSADKAACAAALKWCREQVQGLPLHVTNYEKNGLSSLILTTQRTKCPKVLLLAHIDVVPAAAGMFKLTEDNGRYYGRGAFDMKFAIAGYLKLLHELGDRLPQYDLGVMITSDEEAEGLGVRTLIAEGWRAGVVLNPDAISGWQIERGVKGILRYRAQSHGDHGHGSRPWLYRNALTQMLDYLQDLRGQFTTEPCDDPDHTHTALSVNVFNAGQVINQIPHQATAEFEIRISPTEGLEAVAQKVAAVTKRHAEVSTEALLGKQSTAISIAHPYMQLLGRLITEVSGAIPPLTISHGQSDSFYFREVEVPALTFGTPAGGHHSSKEWIDVKGVEQYYEIIRRFVEAEARLA